MKARRSDIFRKTDRIEAAFYRGGSREPKPIDRSMPVVVKSTNQSREAWLDAYWSANIAKELAKT